MDKALKQRLVGATVIIALAVIVLPMLLSGRPESSSEQPQKMEIPPRPSELSFETRRFPVTDDEESLHPGENTNADAGSANTQQALPAVNAAPEAGNEGPAAAQSPSAESTAPAAGDESQSVLAQDSAAAVPSTETDFDQQNADSKEEMSAASVPEEALGSEDQPSGQQRSDDQSKPAAESKNVVGTQAGNAPGVETGDRYLVQVASLSSAENANGLESQLKKLGFPVLRDTVESDLGRLNRVRVGPFAKETDAAAASTRIKQELKGVSPRVLDLKPGLVAPVTSPNDPLVRWVIQLGSFNDSGNAQKLVDQVRHDGMTAYMETITAKSATTYRVRVGPFLEREEAINTQQKLLDDMKISGVVMSAD